MEGNRAYYQISGFIVVTLTMVEMFTIPRQYFVLGSFVSTIVMICVAFLLHSLNTVRRFVSRTMVVGIITAISLYFIFYLGNSFIKSYSPFGLSYNSENGIYGLFSSEPIALLLAVFLLDAIGFESYFRGNLQNLLGSKLGIGAVFLTALIDALIHISSLNPLFPATTFIADCAWGLNYYYTKDLYSNYISHFVWDVLIFAVIPIH